ncbi:MAG: hypothetical protein LBR29_02380, partial [Methylobacteriaceae bacterium]|nr:hypothetical protein [Methylobacteriaceae bacterium]
MHAMLASGHSRSAIARTLNVHRLTVANFLKRSEA